MDAEKLLSRRWIFWSGVGLMLNLAAGIAPAPAHSMLFLTLALGAWIMAVVSSILERDNDGS